MAEISLSPDDFPTKMVESYLHFHPVRGHSICLVRLIFRLMTNLVLFWIAVNNLLVPFEYIMSYGKLNDPAGDRVDFIGLLLEVYAFQGIWRRGRHQMNNHQIANDENNNSFTGGASEAMPLV